MGFVAYNGEVYAKEELMGYMQADGSIVNKEGSQIAATLSDNSGKYAGRVLPQGNIALGREVVGQLGARAVAYNDKGERIGQVITSGPIFDYKGGMRAHGLRNAQVISLSGTPLGYMISNTAYDNNGRVVGTTFGEKVVFSNNDVYQGLTGISSSLVVGEEKRVVSPLGYVYNSDGVIEGASVSLGNIYGLSGDIISVLYPTGELLNKGAPTVGKITQYGFNIDERNIVLGKVINARYAVDAYGNSLGSLSATNLVLDSKFNPLGKVLPDSSIISETNSSIAQMPVIGRAETKELAISYSGGLLGYINNYGQIRDLNGSMIGKINSRDIALDNTGALLGGSVGYFPAVDNQCVSLGVVSPDGNVRNFREVSMGKILANMQIASEAGNISGYAINPSSVVDYNGNIIGLISASGKVINYNNEILGCVDIQNRLYNQDNALIGKAVEINTVMSFGNMIIGRTTLNGAIINQESQVIGYIRPDDSANSKTGMPIGIMFKYRYAFDNNNKLMGQVLSNGEVVDNSKKVVGNVDVNGNVILNNQTVGYALYDMYVYDTNGYAKGYITSDGNVISFINQNLGKLQKGFLLDTNMQVIARGNRDFYVRDNLNIVVGELKINGEVVNQKNDIVGRLDVGGNILSPDGNVVAVAHFLQYFDLDSRKPIYDKAGNVIGYATKDGTIVDASGNVIGTLDANGVALGLDNSIIGDVKIDWYENAIALEGKSASQEPLPEVGAKVVELDKSKYRRSLNIALTPDGEYLGDILEDGRVINKDGDVVGRVLPDGLVVDEEGSLIGIEEAAKTTSKNEMFVPSGTFGEGGAYGTGSGSGGSSNLGPGGGYGPGERYDQQRSAALSTAQGERRKNMSVGKISTNVNMSAFDGYQKNWDEQGVQKAISSWRVDMSEMIFADKPIPAVIARSIDSSNPAPVTAFVERNIYAEEGRNIIVPAGSRIMGTLGSVSDSKETASESAKIQITWERLVRPDGMIFVFEGITGDAQGRGGALGYLDQQLFKKYSLPLLTTVLTSATSYIFATDDNSDGETETSRQQAANDARENFIDQMNNIFNEILADKTNIRPLTFIPAGTRIIVYPNIDLWLRTAEREADVSTNDATPDVFIDDQAAQDRIARDAVDRQNKNAQSQVLYESQSTEAQPTAVLIDDTPKKAANPMVGATPPPPPSSGGSAASSGKSNNSVPQLF